MSTPQDRQEGEKIFPDEIWISKSYVDDWHVYTKYPSREMVRFIGEHNLPRYVPASRLTELERKLALARELLKLSARCLEIQTQELGAAIKEIDQDPFENWDVGRDVLKVIWYRMRYAAKNSSDALAELGADKPEPGK